MALQRTVNSIEILDRVLDKGIVVDGWLNVSVVGLELIGLEGRMVVASLSTYVKHSKTVDRALGRVRPVRKTPPALRAVKKSATSSAPALPADLGEAPSQLCPRCEKRGRRQDVVLVTVQTNTETRVTARCSVCRWQRTFAA
jgi:hypothetical protein